MKVTIVDDLVRKNIARFQHLLRRYLMKRQKQMDLLSRTYPAFLNAQTGEIRFSDLKKPTGKEWRAIAFAFDKNTGNFEITDEKHPESFEINGLERRALQIMEDTLRTLSGVCALPKKEENSTLMLRNIVHLEMELPEFDEQRRSLVHEAWHSVNRFKAESLLKNQENGTYLFRKGEFAKTLEDTLNEEGEEPVRCITLTFAGTHGKIFEKTLVFKNGEWLFYNDDIELKGTSYPTIRLLLDSVPALTKPLLSA